MEEIIIIKTGTIDLDWNQLFLLYNSVGLVAGNAKKGNYELIKEAFIKSYKVVAAYDKDKLVGAGRMISDGLCYGTIFDVGVLPEYQKKGIGKLIMNELMKGEDELCIYLTSTFGKEVFYKKLGFKKHKTSMAKYPYKSEYLEED